MTVVVFAIDGLDPELLSSNLHTNLTLSSFKPIDTFVCETTGYPHTHELWPTIITGLPPEEHGIIYKGNVAWENPLIRISGRVARHLLPQTVRRRAGKLLENYTDESAFRTPVSYYRKHDLSTVFDGRDAAPIGIPNYVVDPSEKDREHFLRSNMGDLFGQDKSIEGGRGHTTSDPHEFYQRCMEMSMVRLARSRRALRSRDYELVFGYTSSLDLLGHLSYSYPQLQDQAYDEMDDLVGDLVEDLSDDDELLIVSDHGLQDGVHTEKAVISSTDPSLIDDIQSVADIRSAIERELERTDHGLARSPLDIDLSAESDSDEIKDHLADLGYIS